MTLPTRTTACIAGIALLAIAGCSTSNRAARPTAATASPATAEQKAALLDRVKSLQGTWELPPHDGQPGREIVFAVTSNGSVVREIMFPGSTEEMTNLYHMDGPTLVATHYCAIGNQPRMRAAAGGPNDPIDLKFDSVTNLSSADQMYMGGLKIVFVDKDHIEEHWTSYTGGKPDGHQMNPFQLSRKK